MGVKFAKSDLVFGIEGSIYVDDVIKSIPTEEEIETLVVQLPKLLEHAGMKICKFYTNSQKALRKIPEQLRARQVHFTEDEVFYETNKILGTHWSMKVWKDGQSWGSHISCKELPEIWI